MSKQTEMEINKLKKEDSGPELMDDETFAAWMRAKFYEEGAEIIRGLKEDPEIDQMDPPEELFQQICQKAKEKGLLAEEASEKPAKKKGFIRFPNTRAFAKWAAVFVITLMGVFGVSMTSQANRENVMRKVDSLFGNGEETKINNTGNVLESVSQEAKDREAIENKLGIKLPEFFYMPEGMKYLDYLLDEYAGSVVMQYEYNQNKIHIYAIGNGNEANVTFRNDKGHLIKKIDGLAAQIHAELWNVQVENETPPNLIAQWEYKNSFYKIVGRMEQKELEQMIEKLVY